MSANRRCPARSAARCTVIWALWLAASATLGFACASGPSARAPIDGEFADVIAVQATGESGNYLFSVAVSSQDSGCERYADWWEVVRPDGELVFRRVLGHSHTTEQPFTRSGGPVAVDADETVIVRAHMNTSGTSDGNGDGYGGMAMRGTVAGGFAADPTIGPSFAAKLAEMQPLPDGCAF